MMLQVCLSRTCQRVLRIYVVKMHTRRDSGGTDMPIPLNTTGV